jgi:prefoldin subunit 5
VVLFLPSSFTVFLGTPLDIVKRLISEAVSPLKEEIAELKGERDNMRKEINTLRDELKSLQQRQGGNAGS